MNNVCEHVLELYVYTHWRLANAHVSLGPILTE